MQICTRVAHLDLHPCALLRLEPIGVDWASLVTRMAHGVRAAIVRIQAHLLVVVVRLASALAPHIAGGVSCLGRPARDMTAVVSLVGTL